MLLLYSKKLKTKREMNGEDVIDMKTYGARRKRLKSKGARCKLTNICFC